MNLHTLRRRNPRHYRYRQPRHGRFQSFRHKAVSGLTLVEMLVVIVIGSILATILALGWLGLQTANTLNAAQDGVFQAIRQAQTQALNTRQSWQVGFREIDNRVEWATYATSSPPTTADWQPLLSGVRIAPNETTLGKNGNNYFVEFNYKGYAAPPFGRLSLASNWGSRNRRCVFVSTLLGVLRKASDAECYP